MERLAQPFNQVRLAQPLQRFLAFLRRQRDDVGGLLLGPGKFHLRLFHGEQEPGEIALQEIGGKAGFLGGAFNEPAAFLVAAQVHLVKVEAFTMTQAQRDFQRVGAHGFFEAGHAILAPFDFQKPRIVSLLQSSAWRGAGDMGNGAGGSFSLAVGSLSAANTAATKEEEAGAGVLDGKAALGSVCLAVWPWACTLAKPCG